MFKKIKLRVIKGRQLLPFAVAKVLQEHEDRLGTLEGQTDSDTVYDDTSLASRVSALEALVSHDVSFTVNDSSDPVQGAVVTLAGKTGTTGSAGGCSIASIIEGTYTVTVVADGFEDYSDSITVTSSDTSFTISLTAATGSGEI